MTEEFTFEVESSPVSGSTVVSVIDRKEPRALARKTRATMKKTLKELAEKENILEWQSAISSEFLCSVSLISLLLIYLTEQNCNLW